MSDDWTPVFSTDQPYKAEIMIRVLGDNQITAFVLNQQDSSYLFGEIRICVKPSDIVKAKHILDKLEI